MKNNVIVKRNDFLKYGYTLTIMEQRLLLACISQVDSRSKLLKEDQFEVSVQQIQDIFGSDDSKHFYRDLKLSAKRLFNRKIVIRSEGVVEEIRWVWKVKYDEDQKKVVLHFSDDVTQYLSEITERFTKYKLNDVKDFKCIYSLRLYEMFAQHQGLGSREFDVDELRGFLEIGDKYKFHSEFKRCVIDKAISEINLHSNLFVKYGERKRGAKVKSLQFEFQIQNVKAVVEQKKALTIEQFVDQNKSITKGKTTAEVLKMMASSKYT